MIPERLGPWRILRLLGEGGMGLVYLAEGPEGTVALKVLAHEFTAASTRRRFRQEAEVLRRLSHPGFVRYVDHGDSLPTPDGPRPYLAMEYVEGESLRDAIARGLEVGEAIRISEALCAAADHAHELGVVHRDLKPENIVIETSSGRPRILDLGIARIDPDWRKTLAGATRSGELLGTVRYMSPEQARGQVHRLDRRSDVYALAVITYEMMTGAIPYDVHDETLHELLGSILTDDPVPLRVRRPDLPSALDAVVLPALAKDPSRRPATAARFAEGLASIRRGDRVTAARRLWGWRLARGARRSAWPLVAILGGIAVLALGTRWRAGEDDSRALGRAWARLEVALSLVHTGPRTADRLRAAIDSLHAARVDVQGLESLPWRAPLHRYTAHRLGEATYILALREESPRLLREASVLFLESGRTPCDSAQFAAIPPDHPLRVQLTDIGPFSAYAGQGMALQTLADFELPVRQLKLAIVSRSSALRAIEGDPEALRTWQAPVFDKSVSERRRAQHRAYLLNDLAAALSEWAAVTDSLPPLERALTMLEEVGRIRALADDRPAHASYLVHHGVALRRRGEWTGSGADLDSADAFFARALRIRTPAYGPITNAATRVERVRGWIAADGQGSRSGIRTEVPRELAACRAILEDAPFILPRADLALAGADAVLLAAGPDLESLDQLEAADEELSRVLVDLGRLEESSRPQAEILRARAAVRSRLGRPVAARQDLAAAAAVMPADQYPALAGWIAAARAELR